MNDFVYRNYIFSSREFMVLAACAGIRRIEFLLETPQELPGAGETEQVLFGLYQKGVLFWKEDAWELKPEIGFLFKNIREAEPELQIYSRFGEDVLLCFLAEQAVEIETSGNQRDTVRVHGLPFTEFLKELSERELLPSEKTEMEDFRAAKEERERMKTYMSGWEKLGKDGNILSDSLSAFLAEKEKISAAIVVHERNTGRDTGLAFVLDGGLYDWLVLVADGQIRADYYQIDYLWAFLNRKEESKEEGEVESDDSGRYLYAVPGQIV